MSYQYPLRMKSKGSGLIVEFTSLTTGKIVDLSECTSFRHWMKIGYISNDWYEHTNKNRWSKYSPIWLEQTIK